MVTTLSMRPSISDAVPMPDTLAKLTTTRHRSDFINYLAALALVDFADLVVVFIRWFNQFKIDSFSGPIINEIFVYVNALD